MADRPPPGPTVGGRRSGYPIGNSGWGVMTLASPGDLDGDGHADLTASTTAGLEFLPGRRTGLIGAPAVVGYGGWQAMKAIS
ncbi:hypothetical protein [Streptomyces sp. NPDC050856]|uniref:hypothetical protein n=1 Tax=Streptomyces sp. NPDC050856 TaxID=3154939 RepID=UPI0033F55273